MTGWAIAATAGATILSIGMLVSAASAQDRLITATSVGAVRVGFSVAAARKALTGFTLKRTSDGEGVALIGVLKGGKPLMTLYAGEDNSSAPISEKAIIQLIEVTDSGYATKAGVRPGMSLKVVEWRLGKLRKISKSEIESREYAEFTKGPAGLNFRVMAKDGDAGKYAKDASEASGYTPTAYIHSIIVSKP